MMNRLFKVLVFFYNNADEWKKTATAFNTAAGLFFSLIKRANAALDKAIEVYKSLDKQGIKIDVLFLDIVF